MRSQAEYVFFDLHSPGEWGVKIASQPMMVNFGELPFAMALILFTSNQGLGGVDSCAMELSFQEPVYFSPRAEMHFQQLYLGINSTDKSR